MQQNTQQSEGTTFKNILFTTVVCVGGVALGFVLSKKSQEWNLDWEWE